MSSSQAYSNFKSLRCEKRTAMLPDISVHEPAPVRGFDFRSSYVVMWVCQVETETIHRTPDISPSSLRRHFPLY